MDASLVLLCRPRCRHCTSPAAIGSRPGVSNRLGPWALGPLGIASGMDHGWSMLACCHAGPCFHLGPWQQLLAPSSPPTHPPITPHIPVPTFMDVRGQTWISAKTMELVNDGRIISPSRSNDDGRPRVSRRGRQSKSTSTSTTDRLGCV